MVSATARTCESVLPLESSGSLILASIFRIENHAEDIRLSTLETFVSVIGRRLEIKIA